MIYLSADDYGLCESASSHIEECVLKGLTKVSVFPNLEKPDLNRILANKNTKVALHLNLVEGKCMANADKLSLLADQNGNFKNTFGGLFKLNFLKKKEFKAELEKEIKAQVFFWKSLLPKGAPFCIDSHQHTHMIPCVFETLIKVLDEEKVDLDYMRIPVEPLAPYIKTPSLYFTYSPINLIKQWLINFLWLFNKSKAKKLNIKPAYFLGILFSGKVDEKRVTKILPKYIKKAEKSGKDIEVLFHPGFLGEEQLNFKEKNIVFEKFYLSENRKVEYDSIIKITERSVM